MADRGERPEAVLLAPEINSYPSGEMGFADAYSLVRWIRDFPQTQCFPGGIRARTVPIVLAAFGRDIQFYAARRPPIGLRWFRVCHDGRDPTKLVDEVKEAIREWRHAFLEELAYVGYAITRDDYGRLHVGHALLRRKREGDLLAEETSSSGLKKAGWYILKSDVFERDVPALLELENLLNTYRARADLEHVKPETVLQRFFEMHPHLLYRGLFDATYAKVRIPRDARRWYEPDFILRPRRSLADREGGEILDIKLPDVSLLERTSFHRGFFPEGESGNQPTR